MKFPTQEKVQTLVTTPVQVPSANRMDPMMALVASVKQSVAQRNKNAQKKTTTPKPEKSEERLANEAAKRMADELQWTPVGSVMYIQLQRCACGSRTPCVAGLFIEKKHTTLLARKLVALAECPGEAFDPRLPQAMETTEITVPACAQCFQGYDLVGALFSGRSDPRIEGQLRLFPNHF